MGMDDKPVRRIMDIIQEAIRSTRYGITYILLIIMTFFNQFHKEVTERKMRKIAV